MTLNAGFTRTVKRPGRYGDGRGSWGLALLVRPRADGGVRKSWVQRITIDGRRTNLGLGSFPLIGLAEARQRAFQNRRLVEQGVDPRGGGIPIFAEAVERVVDIRRPGWKQGSKSEQIWRSTLEAYAYPVLGRKRVDRVTSNDVMTVFLPIWHSKPPTARLLKQRISTVMRWSIAAGHRLDDPAGDALSAALPSNSGTSKHHRALPHSEVAAALAKVRQSSGHPTPPLALEFQVYTAARPTEARLARWEEIDLGAATWTIPAARTKKSREHRVPLSTGAMAVLTEARQYSNGKGLVFVGKRGGQIGAGTIGGILKRVGIGCVPHGFRSSFRTWAEECGDIPKSVSEAALATPTATKSKTRTYVPTCLFCGAN